MILFYRVCSFVMSAEALCVAKQLIVKVESIPIMLIIDKSQSQCRVKRYPAIPLENIVKRQIFALLNNRSINKNFRDILSKLSQTRSQTSSQLLKLKNKKIEQLEAEIRQLTDVLAQNSLAQGIHTILERLKDSEERLKVLRAERENLEQQAQSDMGSCVDTDFILDGIKKLRSERFRKANLATKRGIVRELVKSIHIHPENVIRVDLWASKDQPKPLRESSRRAGVVLPFRELGWPLDASFHTTAFGGEKYAEIKKSVGIGTYVGLFGGVDHLPEIGEEQRNLPSSRNLNQGNQGTHLNASFSM